MIEMNKGTAPARITAKTVAQYGTLMTFTLLAFFGLVCGIVWSINMNRQCVADTLPTAVSGISSKSLTMDDLICRDKQPLEEGKGWV